MCVILELEMDDGREFDLLIKQGVLLVDLMLLLLLLLPALSANK